MPPPDQLSPAQSPTAEQPAAAADHPPRAAGSTPSPPPRSPTQSVGVASFSAVAMASFSSVVDTGGSTAAPRAVSPSARCSVTPRWTQYPVKPQDRPRLQRAVGSTTMMARTWGWRGQGPRARFRRDSAADSFEVVHNQHQPTPFTLSVGNFRPSQPPPTTSGSSSSTTTYSPKVAAD